MYFSLPTYDWEQRKLEEVSDRVLRRNKNLESKLPLTISAQDGLVDQTTYFHKQVASKQLLNYLLLLKGEFAYNKSYSVGFPYGTIKRLDRYDKGVLSTLYLAFNPKNIYSDFLKHYYDTDKWYHEIYQNSAEGARNHGLLNITATDFFNTKVNIPSNCNEQTKVAKFFNCSARIITLQQRKLSLLQQLKNGLLQIMFSKKGEVVPEVRFPGFTNAWEQRKLGEVASYRNGKAHEKDINESGKYVVVNSKFVSSNGTVRKYSNKMIAPLTKGEISFVLSDVPNGKALARTFLTDQDDTYTLNQRIAGILPKQGINPYFMSTLMNRNSYFLKFDDGVGQTNLSKRDVIEWKAFYPSYAEQEKIGSFLQEFDSLIALHQRKHKQLELLKKSLLQKMFI